MRIKRKAKERYVFLRKEYTRRRKKLNLTLDELEMKTGISKYALSHYGTGNTTPDTPSLAIALAEALGCDVTDLYMRKENENGEVDL